MGFSFVQITDHHLGNTESELMHGYSPSHALRKVVRHIAEHVGDKIDFLLTSGDLVEKASAVSYGNMCQMLRLQAASSAPGPAFITFEGLQDFPLYLLPGNHDDRDNFFRHLFHSQSPMVYMNVRFEHKGIQFLCLDWGPGGKARVHPELLSFLEQSLHNEMPTVILTHHHLVPVGCSWIDNFVPDEQEGDRFWDILATHRKQILGVLSGHAHVTYERIVRGIPIFGLRSTAMQFVLQDEVLFCVQSPHYRLVSIQNNLLTTRIFEVPL